MRGAPNNLTYPALATARDFCYSAGSMSPEAALEAQIERYRKMTCEERVMIALRLHEMSCEMARMGIRRQHPEADAAEVNRLLRERLTIARTL